jgi:hypothetical protein
MSLLPFLTLSPVLVILLKWTALLMLGWTGHWLLRHSHPRWRLILWRSILCFGLAFPLARSFPIPVLKIPIHGIAGATAGVPDLLSPRVTANAMRPHQPTPHLSERPVEAGTTAKSSDPPPPHIFPEPISWKRVLLLIWAFGCVWGTIRLIRFTPFYDFIEEFDGKYGHVHK